MQREAILHWLAAEVRRLRRDVGRLQKAVGQHPEGQRESAGGGGDNLAPAVFGGCELKVGKGDFGGDGVGGGLVVETLYGVDNRASWPTARPGRRRHAQVDDVAVMPATTVQHNLEAQELTTAERVIVDVPEIITEEHFSWRVAPKDAAPPGPRVQKEIAAEAVFIPQERVRYRTVEQNVDIVVPMDLPARAAALRCTGRPSQSTSCHKEP